MRTCWVSRWSPRTLSKNGTTLGSRTRSRSISTSSLDLAEDDPRVWYTLANRSNSSIGFHVRGYRHAYLCAESDCADHLDGAAKRASSFTHRLQSEMARPRR